MENSNNNYCPELWQRIYVGQYNDSFHAMPCCLIEPTAATKVVLSDSTKIFQAYNQSPTVKKLRSENSAGRLNQACDICVRHEKDTGTSGRLGAIQRTKDQNNGLSSYVDLNLGNLCNLSCAICGSYASSSWVPLEIKMKGSVSADYRYRSRNRPIINDPEWFANIRHLQLQGGEVFLQPAYTDFFVNLSTHRDLSEISVTVFTNGTVLPDPELLQRLKQCRNVNVCLSIDDIGKRFEYQRRGAKWDLVLDNIQWYINNSSENFSVQLTPTASLLNLYYYPDYHRFMSDRFPELKISYKNIYNTSTGHCSAHVLPKYIRDVLIERLDIYSEIKHLKGIITEDNSVDLSRFFDYINKYDRATGTSYSQTHPEFWQVLHSKTTYIKA